MGGTGALSRDELDWIRASAAQARMADPLWADRASELYGKYANEWIAIRHGVVVFHAKDEAAFEKWLNHHGPKRHVYLVRFVPDAEVDFAFRCEG